METNSVAFFQSQNTPELPVKPIVAAWKVKNPQNVGSLMRLVDNLGCEELILLDDENDKREASIKKTAGLSYKNVQLRYQSADDFFQQIPEEYSVFAIETSEGATNVFQTELPQRIVFLLGSEMRGLPEELILKCSRVVFIPMTGKCKSMNISHALAVCLFEWQRQQLFAGE
ncbi:TrmH family RNA methyltransferase [Mangrovibacterium diazotrophicum]|uniref:TrmH family RNA methyltransferase n=1 Tax=Mangrovibacterium diazotrophicum TaxID=1261403 RepID=A0A419WB24_9BACT|nr:TrmH family RNA methyltransferase [Mangrovibacterium diazotrophicum]RKD92668.1 TrmH family RNA methyltransferase [Mangrovibacterium diazotrophicum]